MGDEYLSEKEYAKVVHPPTYSKGRYRVLTPSVLERFPQIDRHKLDFPAYIHDYFFSARETVLSSQTVSQLLQGNETDEGFQSHGYSDMHARHGYITTHIFYEDLRNI